MFSGPRDTRRPSMALTSMMGSPRPTLRWLFENRRTLVQAQDDRALLRDLQTGALTIHPLSLQREPWSTLLIRRDAAL